MDKQADLENHAPARARGFDPLSRRQYTAEETNNFLNQYYQTWQGLKAEEADYQKLLDKGENNYVEFKEMMRWSKLKKQPDNKSEHLIAKTLAEFMNTEGGTLFIGVTNEGDIQGLGKDYRTLGDKQNHDGFLLQLDNLLDHSIGKQFHAFLYPKIIHVDNKDICVIKVSESSRSVFVNDDEFYIRAVASAQKPQ